MVEIGNDISKAKDLLDRGEVVSIPTETVYGLAANALDELAVARVFNIKNRPYFDPLIIHTDTIDRVYDYVTNIPSLAYDIGSEIWPGPITILLPKRESIPDIVTSGLPDVAVRIPSHPLTLSLLSEVRYPLAAPSANPFGYISPTSASHVLDQLSNTDLKYILDGGECTVGLESTIISVVDRDIVVHRLGGTTIEELKKFSPRVRIEISGSRPKSPGMLDSHYSPTKDLKIGAIEDLLKEHKDKQIFVISYSEQYSSDNIVGSLILTNSGHINEAAANLFKALREADQSEAELIITERVKDEGLGRAINDRLARASSR